MRLETKGLIIEALIHKVKQQSYQLNVLILHHFLHEFEYNLEDQYKKSKQF